MTDRDMQHIASLKGHPGYAALLKLLDESDNILLERIEKEISPETTTYLLGRWRSNRTFRKLITGQPDALYQELGGTVDPF